MPLRPRRRRPARPGALLDLSPWRIARQIFILQFLYYTSASILLVFTALVAGRSISSDLIFGWEGVRGDTTEGWMIGGVWLLNSFLTTIPIALFIARSKLVPDFALTIHGIHLLSVSLYTHALPTTFFWWLVQAASAALMISLGIWACRWRELRPINFGGGGGNSTGSAVVQGRPGGLAGGVEVSGGGGIGDEEEGVEYAMGGGRKGRDGLGGYEMVQMREAKDGNG